MSRSRVQFPPSAQLNLDLVILKCMSKTLLIASFVFTTLFFQGAAIAGVQYSIDSPVFFEDSNGLPEGVPEPAILIIENEGVPEDPAWTYRYLIPTSLALATIVILGNVIQYFRKVVKERYKVVE